MIIIIIQYKIIIQMHNLIKIKINNKIKLNLKINMSQNKKKNNNNREIKIGILIQKNLKNLVVNLKYYICILNIKIK